jgi:hypothetical protein
MGPGLKPPVKRVSMDGLGGRVIVGLAGAGAVVRFCCFSAILLLLFVLVKRSERQLIVVVFVFLYDFYLGFYCL